jgi:hypothetical protein
LKAQQKMAMMRNIEKMITEALHNHQEVDIIIPHSSSTFSLFLASGRPFSPQLGSGSLHKRLICSPGEIVVSFKR